MTPTYRVDFGDKRLPEQYMKADGVTALTTAIKNKYVTGINEIMQTDRYLLLTCNDGTTVVTIYDKQNQGIMSTRNFYNKKLGAMKMEPHMTYIQNGYLIQYSEMESWTIWKELGVPKNWDDPKYTFYSENMRETFKRLQESDAESNPVIIIQKLKGGV